jgi:hypothetical protein
MICNTELNNSQIHKEGNTDRELLEDAAKAASIKILQDPHGQFRDCTCADPAMNIFSLPLWNPLTDNGNALELAVKLKLCIDHDYVETGTFTFNGITEGEYEAGVEVWRIIPKEPNINIEEVYGNDPLAATRRAIVRAAAEIGRNTK